MTSEEWKNALVDPEGPFAAERFDTLQPEPELLEELRDALRLPWPQENGEMSSIEVESPIPAATLLGMFRDGESAPLLIEALREAMAIRQDWLVEVTLRALPALGMAALEPIRREIERIEQSPDEFLPDSYELVLVGILAALTADSDEARKVFVEMAAQRIADTSHDGEYQQEPDELTSTDERMKFLALEPDRTEIWVSAAYDVHLPELDKIVEDFFTRRGPGYYSNLFGDYEEFVSRPIKASNMDHRAQLLEFYRSYHDRAMTSDLPPFETESPWWEHGVAESMQQTIVRDKPKVGRNEPCPCGSGKKFKKCCGKG